MISRCLVKFNCIRMSVNIWKICLCCQRIDYYSLSSVEIMLGTSDMKVKKLKKGTFVLSAQKVILIPNVSGLALHQW